MDTGIERAAAKGVRPDAEIGNAQDAILREVRRRRRPLMPTPRHHRHRDGGPAAG